MNLKNVINKTEILKNNIKTIFEQIKQSIIRGGGSDFKELAQTPKRIEDLIRQYNKIASGTATLTTPDHNLRVHTVNTNLSFTPKLVFCQTYFKGQYDSTLYYKFTIDSQKNVDEKSRITYPADAISGFFAKDSLTKDSFKLKLDTDGKGTFKVDWIAIE